MPVGPGLHSLRIDMDAAGGEPPPEAALRVEVAGSRDGSPVLAAARFAWSDLEWHGAIRRAEILFAAAEDGPASVVVRLARNADLSVAVVRVAMASCATEVEAVEPAEPAETGASAG
jgi:hypothetical protein